MGRRRWGEGRSDMDGILRDGMLGGEITPLEYVGAVALTFVVFGLLGGVLVYVFLGPILGGWTLLAAAAAFVGTGGAAACIRPVVHFVVALIQAASWW